MNNFGYARANNVAEALRQVAIDRHAKFIAGGTNLIDLMKVNVERPSRLIDISQLPFDRIEESEGGGLKIGALVPNSDLAYDDRVEARYPLLSSAILAGASAQLRNMASTGGNLLQWTRCYYFYDTATPCNKREPGSGCSAISGRNRIHAILGASNSCIATHPSDMCVALAALEALVHVMGQSGHRTIKFADFHRLPGDEPQRDTTLKAGEIITAIELPANGFPKHYTYLKLRDRASYAFALVSIAVGLEMQGTHIVEARVAVGGVAHKPRMRNFCFITGLQPAKHSTKPRRLSLRAHRDTAEEHVGFGGRAFTAYTFRTSPNDGARNLSDDPTPATCLNSVLRDSGLDRLPQLISILRGDMSFVGPRPIRLDSSDHARPDYFAARPGLISVFRTDRSGRLGNRRRAAMDRYYARRWTIWLDVAVLIGSLRLRRIESP